MAADPIRAIRTLRGRPLPVVHGRNDRTDRPAQAQRLFDVAHELKRIVWFDPGHCLPRTATHAAAEQLTGRLEETARSAQRCRDQAQRAMAVPPQRVSYSGIASI